ncbi:hypothetical protein [Flavobacterium marginilacus]|uniref:hypothetical protein n=1 Tax=Flavobacterium marginilacus TaxID=3003256 RepID=UPI00248D9D27|nr:hypothetical protein [Flavobacterium marginilacus]
MKYNLIISTFLSTYNILVIDDDDLQKVVDSYNKGLTSFFINGSRQTFERLNRIKIYTFKAEEFKTGNEFYEFAQSKNLVSRGYMNMYNYIDDKILAQFGDDVTKDFIKNDFGQEKDSKSKIALQIQEYVHPQRIDELNKLSIEGFDLTKLIGLCNELNVANVNGMYLTIPMLIRAIIDHIPPLFGKATFIELTGSYGGRSFQEIMMRLEKSSRKIADSFLHQPIRNKEILPTETQINFKNEIDVLLGEIVRIHK